VAKDTVEVQILAQTKKAIKNVAALTAAIGAAVIAARKVAQAVKGSMDAYLAQEKSLVKLAAALRATGGAVGYNITQMDDMAKSLSSMTGIADQAVHEAQALMTTFTQVGKETFPQAIEAAADMSAMFGQDLQQSVIQLGTALNDPIRGVGRLRRIGISFSEEQKRQIEQFMEANDVMGAQGVILKELQVEFGGVAKAMGETAGGAINKFKNAMTDIKEVLGENLALALAPAAEAIAEFANRNREKFAAIVTNFPEIVRIVFKDALRIMRELMKFENIVVIFKSLGIAIIKILWAAFKEMPGIVINRLKFLLEPFKQLGLFLGEVFSLAWDRFRNFGIDAINGMIQKINSSGLAKFFGIEMGTLERVAVGSITPIGERWDEMIANMTDSGKQFIMGFVNIAIALKDETVAALSEIVDAVSDPAAKQQIQALLTNVESSAERIQAILGGAGGGAGGQGTAGVFHDMSDAMMEAVGAADELTYRFVSAKSIIEETQQQYLDLADTIEGEVLNAFGLLGEALATGEDGWANFARGIIGSLASMLDAIAEQMMVIAIAEKALSSLGPGAKFAAAATAKVAAGVIRGIMTNMTAMAEGGIVTGPTMILAGERGPEAVVPLNKAGGFGMTIHYHVAGNMMKEEEWHAKGAEYQRRRARSY
jgi:ABC-type transporter Mla subunit MlaD